MKSLVMVRPIKRSEVADVQNVFNHKSVIEGLGGFTMEETVKTSAFNARPGLWAAFFGDRPVGAFMMGGRPQIHLIKYGSVGVLPEYRRKRISTALYFAATMQGLLEGRRLFEDTIVGDNAAQHVALPTMGLGLSATLKHRTGSGKSIMIYQGSLVDDRSYFERFLRRTDESEALRFEYYLDDNAITRDWWVKNNELAQKHAITRECFDAITQAGALIRQMANVHIITDRPIESAPQKGQKKVHPSTPALWEAEKAE